jgi:hypothetical protein
VKAGVDLDELADRDLGVDGRRFQFFVPALLERLCAQLAPKDQALVRGVLAKHA